jgi:hypothetical protein
VKFQIGGHGWPCGPTLIPAGTIIDETTTPSMPPPIDAIALDEEAALALAMAYEEHATICGWSHMHFHPSIDRNAILDQARHKKRWPNGEPAPPPITAMKTERETPRLRPRSKRK